MQISKFQIVGIIVVISLAALMFVDGDASNNSSSTKPTPTPAPSTTPPDDTEDTTGTRLRDDEQSHAGKYLEYSEANLAQAHEEGTAILFFHAAWCPTCRALDAELTKNAADIPSGVTILKADYDTEDELKDIYNIVTQHTLVVVGEDGAELKKWVGGDLGTIITNVT